MALSSRRRSTVRAKVKRAEHSAEHEMKPAVFLDRDGTLMHDVNYCSHPDQVILINGVRQALERLQQAGYMLFIITNQSGIGRGLLTEQEFFAVQEELYRQLGDGLISQTYFCVDLPGTANTRRKPSPAMVLEAVREHGVDISRSWIIGDKEIDMQCGKQVELGTILVRTGYGATTPKEAADYVAETIVEAVDIIMS